MPYDVTKAGIANLVGAVSYLSGARVVVPESKPIL